METIGGILCAIVACIVLWPMLKRLINKSSGSAGRTEVEERDGEKIIWFNKKGH